MGNSIVLAGLDRKSEAALAAALGGPAERFFLLAQRILWGVSQSDLIKVDVAKSAGALVRAYPATPASHLLAAYALHTSNRPAADEALVEARRLATPTHPLAYLMPSDDDWACHVGAARLECIIPDRMWRVAHQAPMTGSALLTQNCSTIVRCEGGELVIINPVPLSDSVREEVDAIGPVSSFAVQGKSHSRWVQATAEAFPEARGYGTAGHKSHTASSHLRFDGILADKGARFHEEFDEIAIEGTELAEVALLHRPTGVLIVQDLLISNLASDMPRPFLARLYAFGFGVSDRIGIPSYQPMLWNDLTSMQRSLRRLRNSDYSGVVGAHWGLARGESLVAFNSELRWLEELGKMEHKKMLLRFFARQPGFLRDLVSYKRSQKKLARR